MSIDENIPAIVVLLKGYATGTQLRFVHENILDQLRKHGMSKVLGDDTGLPTIHAEDQTWIVENWMPRAIAAGLRAAAGRHSDSYFANLSIGRIQSAAQAGLALRSFADIDEARGWLTGV